jgi:hypothetical protein
MAGPGSPTAPPVFAAATATTPPLPTQQSALSTGAINALTTVVYGLQRQMDDLNPRLAALESRQSPSKRPPDLTRVGGIPAFPTAVLVVPERVNSTAAFPTYFTTTLQPAAWSQPSAATMVTPAATAATTSVTTTPPPAAFPSFTAPSPVPPQQHYEGIFYGGVDVIQVPAAAAAALPQLVKKAFARENASHVSAAVRLQAAARSLIARRRLQEMRQ